MKTLKTLAAIAALALLVAMPAVAQEPAEDPVQDPMQDPATEPSTLDDETALEAEDRTAEGEPLDAPQADAPVVDEEREADGTLPRTASPLALLALLGATGLGAAAGARHLRRQ